MKKLFLFFSFLTIISCKSQNNNNMNEPVIDNKFEKFKEVSFNTITQENDLVKRGYIGDEKYLEIFYNKDSFKIVLITPKNSYFSTYKEYYKNNIKVKGLRFNNNGYRYPFRKGIWYEFDENGKLIKEIDYDQPFKFTFEEIVKFCEKENIPLTKGPVINGYHTAIYRNAENEPPIWEIEWLKKPDVIETITLDGISGKVLSRTEANYINN